MTAAGAIRRTSTPPPDDFTDRPPRRVVVAGVLDDALPPAQIDEATRDTLRGVSDSTANRILAGVGVASILLSILSATWYLSATMATKADVAEIRREMNEHMRELRQYLMDHVDGHPTADD